MTMKINQLKAGTVLSYFYIFTNAIINLLYTPIMLNLLGKGEFGLYTVVSSIVGYLGLLSFGINGAYLKFYSEEAESDDESSVGRLNAMFLLVFIFISIIALIGGIIISFYSNNILGDKFSTNELSKAKLLIIILAINVSINLLSNVFSGFIVAHEKFVFQKILLILSVFFGPMISFPLLLSGLGSFSLVFSMLFVSLLTLFVNVLFCLKFLKMPFIFSKLKFSKLKEIYVFSFFIFLNQIIDQANWNVDSFLIGRFWGSGEAAIYGLASRINQLYLTFSVAISSVFAPRINRIVAKNNKPNIELNQLFIKVGRIQFIILGFCLMFLILLGKPFLIFMGGNIDYAKAYPALLLLLIPVTVPLIQNIGIEIQRAKNKHKFRSIIYLIIAFINIAISIPLSKMYGSTGAAIGTAVSLIVGNFIIMNWYYEKHLDLEIKLFWKNILKLMEGMIIPTIYSIFCYCLIKEVNLFCFFAVASGLVIIYCVSMWFISMNKYEKNLIYDYIYKLKVNDKNEENL